MDLLPARAAYRAAAARYLAVEARRWATQLTLQQLIARGAAPVAITIADEAVRQAAGAFREATLALELAELALRAAIPIPLPLETFL